MERKLALNTTVFENQRILKMQPEEPVRLVPVVRLIVDIETAGFNDRARHSGPG
jgi:hypothetical protein